MMRATNFFRLLTLTILLLSITACGANSPIVSSAYTLQFMEQNK